MAAERFDTLVKLRRRAVDDARAALAESIQAEFTAEQEAIAAQRMIARETEAASRLGGDDAVVEAFAAWLPHARAIARKADDTLMASRDYTARARTALGMARSALRAAETLRANALEEERVLALRAEQRALDEAHRPPR